ncbi:hypothetical protein [Nocardiopsis sp. YSL2]|uniref:hypothetical protein n=1 Tax=Nocardiopsis sp. YSL2 TaxID=2939492 RepID=UPI0026F40D25|nr:hypothetical protein [Nocardiopsis sp. YSL2]
MVKEDDTHVIPQLQLWQVAFTLAAVVLIVAIGVYKESLAASVLAPTLSGASALLIVFLTINLSKRAHEQAKASAGLLEVERKSLEEAIRQGETSKKQASEAFIATLKAQADERTSSIMVRKTEARLDSYKPHQGNGYLPAFDDYTNESNIDVDELDGRSWIKVAVYFRVVSFGKVPTRLYVTIPGHVSSRYGNFEWLGNRLGKISGYPLIPENEIFIKWTTLVPIHEIHEDVGYVGKPDGGPAQVRFRSVSLDGSVVEEIVISFRFSINLNLDTRKITGIGLKVESDPLVERTYPKIPN